jgi:hypothetical protein
VSAKSIKGAGNVNVGSAATVGAKLQSAGSTEIGGSAQAGGGLQSGGEMTVGGSLNIGGSANVGGSINAGGPVTIGGTSNVSPGGAGGGAVQPKRVHEPIQPSPLQEAWPVQRKSESQVEAPAVMHAAVPGQVSDSPIEIIPPRRPRPQSAPTLIQKKPVKSESVPESQPEAAISDQSIPTEIGPLPQDLWRLLDQEPPQLESESQPIKEKKINRKMEPSQSHPAQPESILNDLSKPPETELNPSKNESLLAPLSPTIQRTEAAGDESSSESDSGEAGSEVDTDELARKVYAEIKRRLTTEWERFRNYF